jgi:hypothetical protein
LKLKLKITAGELDLGRLMDEWELNQAWYAEI